MMFLFQNTLRNNNTKKTELVSKRRTFDKVEEKMNHIEASLSSTSVMKSDSHVPYHENLDKSIVIRLKKELEEKEITAQK